MSIFKKLLLANIIVATCITVYANSNELLTSNNTRGFLIHTTQINTDQKMPLIGTIKLNLGEGNDSDCKIKTEALTLPGVFVNGIKFYLPGDLLAKIYGLGFSCAQEIYSVRNGSTQTVAYDLINDGETYTNTNPNRQEVNLSKR